MTTDLETEITKLERWQTDFDAYLHQTPIGAMPQHRMGVHWIPASNRAADHAYMQALRPGVIKVVSLDVGRLNEAYSYLDPSPNSVLVIRDHPLSEQKADMTRDPVGTGKRHAAEWRQKMTTTFSHFDRKRVAVCGINEPFVRTAAEEEIVVAYTTALLTDLTAYDIRCLALNLSVGWPRNADTPTQKNTKPVWDAFLPLESLILQGDHFLCLHEYWRNDPLDSVYVSREGEAWGWTALRHYACPMSVPIIIGECGLSKEVNGNPAPGQSDGWIGNVSPAVYADQLWTYEQACHDNVLAVLPFTTDMASADWKNDDTLPAHNDILAGIQPHSWPAVWPVRNEAPETEPEMNLLIWPKMDKISGYYGQLYGDFSHEGLDISRVVGTPIYAPFDGVVAYSAFDSEQNIYGNYIRTWHEELMVCFFFAHLSQRLVQYGDAVKQGQLIGYTGNTGNSSGPHLHFEVRAMEGRYAYKEHFSVHSNARLDPLGFLTGWLAAGNKVEYR